MHLGRSALQHPFFLQGVRSTPCSWANPNFGASTLEPGAIRRMSFSFGMYRKGYEKIFEVHPAMLIQRSQFPFSLVELLL